MTDSEKLKMIADEMRGSADVAYGKPATVMITSKTLREYASELDRISLAMATRK